MCEGSLPASVSPSTTAFNLAQKIDGWMRGTELANREESEERQ